MRKLTPIPIDATAHAVYLTGAAINSLIQALPSGTGLTAQKGSLNLVKHEVFTLGFNKFRVQSERYHKNQVFLHKIHLYTI